VDDADRSALVIENDPTEDVRRLGSWLTSAGLHPAVVRPHRGEPLPDQLDGYAALVVLGRHRYPPHAQPVPWRSACEAVLRRAVRHRVPTLAICLGAQLLATAHGGSVAPARAGPELGPALVARRDAAGADPLFAEAPFLPDVFQWHHDEITELPAGAVLLAASTHYPHQAFRLGPAAWGLQFHIEPDLAVLASWAAEDAELLGRLGREVDQVVAACEAVLDHVTEVWRPFAARFAALALGRPTRLPGLPLLES
jgi:GMP synthase-like glutamine amidotransferase